MKNDKLFRMLKKIEISLIKQELKKAEINRLKRNNDLINKYNINEKPYLVLVPESLMKLYVLDVLYDCLFFKTVDELLEYVEKNNIELFNSIYIIDYVGDMCGMSDVIKISSKKDSKYITALNKYKIAVYDYENSFLEKRNCWNLEFDMTEKIYDGLEKSGVKLKSNNSKFTRNNTVLPGKEKIYKFNPKNNG